MQARRTIEHGAEAGWSSVAVHLAPATGGKEGFYLTLFPDARPPTVVFLRPPQLSQLVELAGQANVTDQQIWDVVAKIPMEPLLPARSLYPRLRALLVDSRVVDSRADPRAGRAAAAEEPVDRRRAGAGRGLRGALVRRFDRRSAGGEPPDDSGDGYP